VNTANLFLDGLLPADPPSALARRGLTEHDLDVLAEHHENHGAGRSTTFLLVYDTSMQWGVPGAPALKSLVVERDQRAGLYRLACERHSLVGLGQAWLIARGCPREPILTLPDWLLEPADEATRVLEERLVDGGAEMTVWDSWSDSDETWVVVQDRAAKVLPVRVLLEQPAYDAGTYTLTEGAFGTVAAARDWLEGDRDTPMPQPPGPRFTERRARAASSRSAHAPGPASSPSDVLPPRQPGHPDGPGRSR